MKRIALLLLVAGFCLPKGEAKIINVPTCSQDDFEHAYYVQSVPGDTIVLPAGSATWGNSSRNNQGVIYIITDVTVVGQGDSTVITLDDTGKTYSAGVIALWSAATFSHFKIVGSNAAPVTAFQIVPYTNPGGAPYIEPAKGLAFTGGFRITDITYVGGTGPSADAYFAYVSSGVDFGLIDHCRITGNNGGAELILGRGPTNAWQVPSQVGTSKNIFIEDNTFNNTGYVCDANSFAGFVVRFNTINGQNKVDGHGVASNSPPRSFRSLEVYGNHWTGGGASATAIEIRGGTAMIFDNVSDLAGPTAAGDRFFLSDYGYLGMWPNFAYVFQVPNSYYPIKDQVGVGMDPIVAGSEPAYIWHNLKNSAPWGRTMNFISDFTCNTDAAGYPIGATSITLQSMPQQMYPGNGVAFAGDPNRYFINNVLTPSSTPVTLQLASPGLVQAIPAAVTQVTMGPSPSYQKRSGNTGLMSDAVAIQSNRDFFADAGFDTNTGVSRGTKSAMLAFTPSIVGYGWWVTDEGSWNANLPANTSGRLYTWNGSAWVLKYTPYIYPHPLQSGGAVIAPSNQQVSILVH